MTFCNLSFSHATPLLLLFQLLVLSAHCTSFQSWQKLTSSAEEQAKSLQNNKEHDERENKHIHRIHGSFVSSLSKYI